jgi:hypothetical protein
VNEGGCWAAICGHADHHHGLDHVLHYGPWDMISSSYPCGGMYFAIGCCIWSFGVIVSISSMSSSFLFCWAHEIKVNDIFGRASFSIVGILILNLLG